MSNSTYSREFKLQVVLEALQSDGTDAEVARAYDAHPVTLSGWKTKLKENGTKAFRAGNELKEKKEKIAKMERKAGTDLFVGLTGEVPGQHLLQVALPSGPERPRGNIRTTSNILAPTTTGRIARISPLKKSKS